jgi:hypothetical protein
MLKYYIQRADAINIRTKWVGMEMVELASDLEALDRLVVVAILMERRSSKLSTTRLRVIDGAGCVIATFSPNPAKLGGSSC